MIESLAEYDTKYQMKKMYDTICMILYIASRFFGKSGSMIQYVGYYIYYHRRPISLIFVSLKSRMRKLSKQAHNTGTEIRQTFG